MPYGEVLSLGSPGNLSTSFTFSDVVSIQGKVAQIQIRAIGVSGDSDDIEVYQLEGNATEGIHLGNLTLDGDNEVAKSFNTITAKLFKIGLKMQLGSSETPSYAWNYVTNTSVDNGFKEDDIENGFIGFTFKVKTDNAGTSNDDQFTLPLKSGETYNCLISWGDGTQTVQTTTSSPTHTYPSSGTYTIEVTGIFPSIYFNNAGDKSKLIEIVQWGNVIWETFLVAFKGCDNLVSVAETSANTNSVTRMDQMFASCTSITSFGVSSFNTSNVTRMDTMFNACTAALVPPVVSGWDTAKVTDMSNMFSFMSSITSPPDTSGFDTAACTDISFMFRENVAMLTPPDTSVWDTGLVTRIEWMFINCEVMATPPDLSGWDTADVTHMSHMFNGCDAMATPPDTSGWDTGSCITMDSMFRDCKAITAAPHVSGFDTAACTTFVHMFRNCNSMTAAPDVSSWVTSACTNMSFMFYACSSMTASPDITAFDTAIVTTFADMFGFCSSMTFNRNIGALDVTALTTALRMFDNSGIAQSNYDNLLIGWEGQAVLDNVPFHAGASSQYSAGAAATARQDLIDDHTWNITDGGQA